MAFMKQPVEEFEVVARPQERGKVSPFVKALIETVTTGKALRVSVGERDVHKVMQSYRYALKRQHLKFRYRTIPTEPGVMLIWAARPISSDDMTHHTNVPVSGTA